MLCQYLDLVLWKPSTIPTRAFSRYGRELLLAVLHSTHDVFYSHIALLSVYSSKHRGFYLNQVHLTAPEWFFHPYTLQIPYARSFVFLSHLLAQFFSELFFFRARVTHALLSQQESGNMVKSGVSLLRMTALRRLVSDKLCVGDQDVKATGLNN